MGIVLGRVSRRAVIGALCTAAMALPGPSPIAAGSEIDPTPSNGRGALAPGQVVTYRWVATIPAYVRTAYTTALETDFENATWNNSRSPTFAASSSGTATMSWDAVDDSPCSSVTNLQWLQCARNWATTSLQIHVRDLESDGGQYPQPATATPSWVWWDTNGRCTRPGCWYLRRSLIHEIGHAILDFNHYQTDPDSSTNTTGADTVMRSTAPEYGTSDGNRVVLQRCDQAGAQLTWDVRSFAGPYANCYGDVPGAGAEGLLTSITSSISGQTIPLCSGETVFVTGRLQVQDVPGYGLLGGNPLQARLVTWDRGTTIAYGSTTTTVASPSGPGSNWSHPFGGTASWTVYFRSPSTTDGLDDSNRVTFTTRVQSPC